MDCLGYISWLIHEGLGNTANMSAFFVYKDKLQTDELFQKVYEKKITVFNRGYIGQVLQLHQECTSIGFVLQGDRPHHKPLHRTTT